MIVVYQSNKNAKETEKKKSKVNWSGDLNFAQIQIEWQHVLCVSVHAKFPFAHRPIEIETNRSIDVKWRINRPIQNKLQQIQVIKRRTAKNKTLSVFVYTIYILYIYITGRERESSGLKMMNSQRQMCKAMPMVESNQIVAWCMETVNGEQQQEILFSNILFLSSELVCVK